MKIIKKMLDIPIKYTIIFGLIATILIVLTVQGDITWPITIGISLITLLVVLQMDLGSIVIKTIISSIIVVYSAAIYTSAVMSLHGNIVEPFLLTIAAATLFLAQSYDKKRMYYGIRSRALWTAVLVFLLVALKLSLILSEYSFMITELVGANLLLLFIAIWRLWLHNSSKTIMIRPTIEKMEDEEKFRKIYLETKLNARNKVWLNGFLKKRQNNANAYIYHEALKAKEEGLQVIFIYTKSTSNIYDIGEIKLSKRNKIKYLYLESESGIIPPEALNDLIRKDEKGL